MSDDLSLWRTRRPVTPERWARLSILLYQGGPLPNNPTAIDVMLRFLGDSDRLAQFLALLLDYPVEWVNRFYSLAGAVKVTTEFLLEVDPIEGVERTKRNRKAQAILRGEL